MTKGLSNLQDKISSSRLEEGEKLFSSVSVVMDFLHKEFKARPQPEYADVHLLCESLAMMFAPKLVVQHGFIYHLTARAAAYDGSEPSNTLQKLGMEVVLHFQKDKIVPKLGYLKVFPHSWLLHERSGTIIDLLPLGGEMGIDYPRRHVPHEARAPFNVDPSFELLRGKLPKVARVKKLHDMLEAWVKESSVGDLSTILG